METQTVSCAMPRGLQSGFDLRHQGIVDDHVRFEVQRLDLKNTYPFSLPLDNSK